VEGLDHALFASAVANGLSRQFDRTFKRGAGNKLLGPYLLIKLIPGYDTISMLDEIDEKVEHSRLQMDGLAVSV
jgi:hypothetical protein